MKAEKGKIVVEKVESIADKFHGKFKVKKWPKDLDELLEAQMRESWEE